MSGVNLRLQFGLLIGCGVLFACSDSIETQEIEITFDGTDCDASGPTNIETGTLLVDLNKQAEGVVVVDLYRLDEGRTWQELASHYGSAGTFTLPPAWVTGVSGRDVGGDLYDREYRLDSGSYGIVCLYMGPETNATWPATQIEVRKGRDA